MAVSITRVSGVELAADAGAYLANMALGPVADDRRIVVFVASRASGNGGNALTGVTVGGNAATSIVNQRAVGDNISVGALFTIPAGKGSALEAATTADIRATFNATMLRCAFDVFVLRGAGDLAASGGRSYRDNASPLAPSIGIPANGTALFGGAVATLNGGGSATWSGATETSDRSVENFLVATTATRSASAAETVEPSVTVTNTPTDAAIVGASWAPARTPVVATHTATLAPMTGASNARAPVRGSGNGTLAPLVGSASARSVVRAVADAVLGALTGASTARVPAKGDGAGVLRPLTGEASARAIVKGSGHATLGELTGAAVARAPVKAWASTVLGLLTGAGLGGQERALRASPSRTIRLARELRRIVLKREARLVRLTQGGRMNPERWPDKDPDDVADFAIGWGDFLGADSIVSAEWIATDGLVVERSSIQGAETIVRLSGGRAGRFAMVTCRILTERGDRFDRSVKLAIFER